MEQTEKKKIFLSHAFPDRKIADNIIEKIIVPIFYIDKQKDIFYTSKRETGIRSGLNWRNKIKTNLQDCNIFIALITSNYKKSEMCLGELGGAWVLNKRIYSLILPPIKYENFSVILSELQADILIKREDIRSFIGSMTIDLKQLYDVDLKQNIDLDFFVNKFISSIKQYLKRNPDLFKPSSTVDTKRNEKETMKEIQKIKETVIESVSSNEKKSIVEQSKEEWPDDYSMQEYYINEQIDALKNLRKLQNEVKNIPEKVKIIQKAIIEWPKDYTMQLYIAKEDIDAFGRLNKNHT